MKGVLGYTLQKWAAIYFVVSWTSVFDAEAASRSTTRSVKASWYYNERAILEDLEDGRATAKNGSNTMVRATAHDRPRPQGPAR